MQKKLENELRNLMVRVEVDDSNDSLNKKIRTNVKRKIPNILVVGEKEKDGDLVTLRRYGREDQEQMGREQFYTWLTHQIKNRKLSL